MKKFLLVIMCICMAVTSYALAGNNSVFEYDDLDVTIVFDGTSQLSDDTQQYIADLIAYGDSNEGISTCAACWLVGHNLTAELVAQIEHKADVLAPRCYKTMYEVETCSSCNYVNITELGGTYINCCPED